MRIIAATNRDLEREMREGRFRADLYYRLSVFPVSLPPLRDRPEDIPLLVWHFVSRKQGRMGKTIKRVPDRLMRALTAYAWPGNVRELENVVERALILSEGTTLAADSVLVSTARERRAGRRQRHSRGGGARPHPRRARRVQLEGRRPRQRRRPPRPQPLDAAVPHEEARHRAAGQRKGLKTPDPLDGGSIRSATIAVRE